MPMTPNQKAYLICMERGHQSGGFEVTGTYPTGTETCRFCLSHFVAEYIKREIDTPFGTNSEIAKGFNDSPAYQIVILRKRPA